MDSCQIFQKYLSSHSRNTCLSIGHILGLYCHGGGEAATARRNCNKNSRNNNNNDDDVHIGNQ